MVSSDHEANSGVRCRSVGSRSEAKVPPTAVIPALSRLPASSSSMGPASFAGYKRDLASLGGLFLVASLVLLLVLRWTYALVADDVAELSGSSSSAWPVIPILAPSVPGEPVRPSLFQAVQGQGDLLRELALRHPLPLLLAHGSCFLWLQAFAIPGTIFFNLTAAPLFGMSLGYPLCLLYNTVGSCLLYLMSQGFMRRLILRFWSKKLEQLRQSSPLLRRSLLDGGLEDSSKAGESSRRLDLFIYMVSLRVFPFTPNWFVNVASAHVLPESRLRNLGLFALSVFVGLAPYNYITCKSGLVLSQLTSQSDIIDKWTTVQLATLALVVFVLPTVIKRWRGPAASPPAAVKALHNQD